MSTIVPITQARHAGQRWHARSHYGFAARDAVVPLVAQELPSALASMALALVKKGEGFVPVAVTGVQPGVNVYLDAEGRWRGNYVPALLRAWPFSLGRTEAGERVLCIDEASGTVLPAEAQPGGVAFFDEAGQVSEPISRILSFLGALETQRLVTQRICETLQQLGLIQPWDILLKGPQGQAQKIDGLYRIDEARLNALSDAAFLALRKAGGLPFAYCLLLSMHQLELLQRRAEHHAQHLTTAAASPAASLLKGDELDLSFLEKGDTLRLGGL